MQFRGYLIVDEMRVDFVDTMRQLSSLKSETATQPSSFS